MVRLPVENRQTRADAHRQALRFRAWHRTETMTEPTNKELLERIKED